MNIYQVTGTFTFQTQADDTDQVRQTLHQVLSQKGWSDKNFELRVIRVEPTPSPITSTTKTGAAPTPSKVKGKATKKFKVKGVKTPKKLKNILSDEELLKQLKEQLRSQTS